MSLTEKGGPPPPIMFAHKSSRTLPEPTGIDIVARDDEVSNRACEAAERAHQRVQCVAGRA